MGIATVAVYSEADSSNPHVIACDDAVALGGMAAADNYLCIDKLIAAAHATRADSIHPGYGFLAENAEFASAVNAAGLVFIGPPASAIAAMGDKARARQRMAAVGIPVVPGYDGDDRAAATFEREAGRIGYPVMIKAAAGGGGRGMRAGDEGARRCPRRRWRSAARRSGQGGLRRRHRLILRALPSPRTAPRRGAGVRRQHTAGCCALGERDCSVQRRHQKVIEESPSPAVGAELRARMGAAAVAVAREIGYVGAGTVEFLLDRSGEFYFMEMNTRLQVEHPATRRSPADRHLCGVAVARGARGTPAVATG